MNRPSLRITRRILGALSRTKVGLTIAGTAREVKVNRLTAKQHLLRLSQSGAVEENRIGNYRVFICKIERPVSPERVVELESDHDHEKTYGLQYSYETNNYTKGEHDE